MSKYGVFSEPYFPSVFSPNAGKYGPEKTPYLDTFHAVVISRITSRFIQKDYSKYYAKMESLLLSAANSKEFQQDLSGVCNFYGDNFNRCRLETQLATLSTTFYSENYSAIDVSMVINYVQKLSNEQKFFFSKVVALAK